MAQKGRDAGVVAPLLLFAAAALAPLPFGSNELAAVAFWCIVLGLCLLCCPVRGLKSGRLVAFCIGVSIVAAYGLVVLLLLALDLHPPRSGRSSRRPPRPGSDRIGIDILLS